MSLVAYGYTLDSTAGGGGTILAVTEVVTVSDDAINVTIEDGRVVVEVMD